MLSVLKPITRKFLPIRLKSRLNIGLENGQGAVANDEAGPHLLAALPAPIVDVEQGPEDVRHQDSSTAAAEAEGGVSEAHVHVVLNLPQTSEGQDPAKSAEPEPILVVAYWLPILDIMYKILIKILALFICVSNKGSEVAAQQQRTKRQGVGFDDDAVPKGKICSSQIYCQGKLLDMVQKAKIFEDGKHFVDMKLKFLPTVVLDNFEQFLIDYPNPTPVKIKEFVFDNFDPPGSELIDVVPADFSESPKFLERIHDANVREWASELHQLWKKLGKKVVDDVRDNPSQYSILYVPHPTIVPGGRFREFYYWDSYWTIRGLLVSGMTDTVKGMLLNFLALVERFGFVPNGGRIYYSQRSQPPFLIPMVKEYVDATGDTEFLRQNMATLEKEYRFWINSRTDTIEKDGKKYQLSRYNTFGNEPRPESYREDMETVEGLSPKAQANLHSQIQAACESGWDFSSRWFKEAGDIHGSLKDLHTRNIYPVDLNSLMVMNARILSDFYELLGDEQRQIQYQVIADQRNESLQELLYDSDQGMWFDYDRTEKRRRDVFYASNLFPLWTEAFPQGLHKYEIVQKALKYLRRQGVLSFPGGFPTSLSESDEQWDFPNGWAPLQHVVIEGLEKTGNPLAIATAADLARKWMRNNYLTWKKHDAMYEKYNTNNIGYPGHGGEYRVVDGFGWTNGVALDLLMKYSDFDTTEDHGEALGTTAAPTSTASEDIYGDLVLYESLTRL